MMRKSEEYFSHLSLDQTERSKLLCRLDDAPANQARRNRRRWKRWEYRRSDIAVIVRHPGGGLGRYLVCARNLSAGGISFIHGGYIHTGSDCRVVLLRRDGTPLAVAGVVVHCRHIESSHHEIGIQFHKEVDPTTILPASTLAGANEDDQSLEMPALDGRLLVVDQSPADRRLMTHHLSATGITMMMVESSGAALEALKRRSFDIVLCELSLADDAVRMIKQMREVEFRGPIVVVTAENDAARLIKAREAGANEIVGKPYDPGYLASLLAEWLDAPGVDPPIYSSIEDKPGMAELITDFIEQAQRKANALEKALKDEDKGRVREAVLALMGSGAGYGFEGLTEAARATLIALETSSNLKDLEAPLRRLVAICQRLRCSSSVRPAGGDWSRSAA